MCPDRPVRQLVQRAALVHKAAEAERQREELLADAYAQAQAIRGQGDGEAAAIYSDSYGKNPEFYRFYRSLEAYRSAFSKQTDTLVISPDSDFFKYWGQQGSPAAPAN